MLALTSFARALRATCARMRGPLVVLALAAGLNVALTTESGRAQEPKQNAGDEERLSRLLRERISQEAQHDPHMLERLSRLSEEQHSWLMEALEHDEGSHLRDVLTWVDPDGENTVSSENAANAQTSSSPANFVTKALPGGAAAKPFVTSQQLALPKGEGSIQGMGESFTPQLSSGTGTFSVPIALPAGRAGVNPTLTLSYSTSGGNGPLGIGWSMGVPFISRQTDKGFPRYVDSAKWTPQEDRFIYNGGQELVPVSNADAQRIDGAPVPPELATFQQYRARVEGAFMRFFRAPDGSRWVVQSKDGTRFDFGAAPGSPVGSAVQSDPEDPRRIFAWTLVRMSDAHGSSVQYQYRQDAGNLYLTDIYYDMPARCGVVARPADTRACNAPLASYGRCVHFIYDTREDVAFSYHTTWRTEQRLRLIRLLVTSHNGSEGQRFLVRRYHFSYDTLSFHSLLTSLEVEGRPTRFDSALQVNVQTEPVPESRLCDTCDAIVGTLMPAMTFSYSQPFALGPQVSGFGGIDGTIHTATVSPSRSLDDRTTDLFDVNGDGLTDVVSMDNGVRVFFNGFQAKGVAQPATFSDPVTLGIPSGMASVLELSNPNIQPMDVDGDGHGDFLHMPKRQEYGYFVASKSPSTVRGFAPLDGWSLVHVPVKLPAGQDPRVDLTSNTPFIKTMDVNGDALIDVVRTSGTSIQVWLNLGLYPGGDGRFGSVSYGAQGPILSTQPVTTCLPKAGTFVDFSEARTRLADLNGDGILDIVQLSPQSVVYWPGRGEGAFGDGPRTCSAQNLGARHLTMQNPPTQLNANLTGVHLVDVNADGADDLVQVDFKHTSVWFNRLGKGFTERLVIDTPFASTSLNRVRIADIDASGTTDILFGDANHYRWIDPMGGQKPRLLTTIDNGLGALTTLSYDSSAHDYLRDLASSLACDPARYDCFTWHRESGASPGAPACDQRIKAKTGLCVHRPGTNPVLSNVVRRMRTTDRLNLLGVAETVSDTEYLYHDGYYEGIEQEFRGFGAADAVVHGDAREPSNIVRTYFHQGRRPNEVASDRLAENPYEALKGLEYLSEVSSATGTYASSRHSTYRIRELLTGLDGRLISYAYASADDELRYDVAPFTPSTATLALPSVERERATATLNGTPTSLGSDAAQAVAVRGARYARLRNTVDAVDNTGNVRQKTAHGRVDANEAIVSYEESSRVDDANCTNSGWLFRTSRSFVRDRSARQNLQDATNAYSPCGDLVYTQTPITLPADLPSGYTFQGGAAPAGLAYTQAAQMMEMSSTNDVWGQPLQKCVGADLRTQPRHLCMRYSELAYDPAYQTFASSELVATSFNANVMRSLVTEATWDPGLGVVATVLDPAGQLSKVFYDGLGRITGTVLPPVRSAAGTCAANVPTTRIFYELTTSPTTRPLNRIHTFNEYDCRGVGRDTQESYAYVDGAGRVRAKLSEGDPSSATWSDGRGHAWTRSGVQSLTAKGKPWRAYQQGFFDGSPDQWSAALALPALPYTEIHYDAFGRVTRKIAEDGTSYTRALYHATSTDVYDEVDVDDRCPAGDDQCSVGAANAPVFADDRHPSWFDHTFSTAEVDGHGRTIGQHLRQAHADGGLEHHYLFSYYRADGMVTRVVRALAPDGTARPSEGSLSGLTEAMTRTFVYDSAGRRIGTNDPDTNNPGEGKTTATWRYLFNRAGDLVAVRDPRGAGQNFFYDRAGRLVGEQYIAGAAGSENPQEARHESVPNDAVGLEILGSNTPVNVRYYFDQPVDWIDWSKAPLPNTWSAGRLTGESDRGERVAFTYDPRGNITWISKQMALVSPASKLEKRRDPSGKVIPQTSLFPDYVETPSAVQVLSFDTTHNYEVMQSWDHASRAERTTFPKDPDFVGAGVGGANAPVVEGVMRYNPAGQSSGVDLTIDGIRYPVVNTTVFERDFAISRMVFGQGAQAFQADFRYDDRRRPVESSTTRTPSQSAARGTLSAIRTLTAQAFEWDPASNLIEIRDLRTASEWPDGHKPQSVHVETDALYRVERAEYTYPSSSGDLATDFRNVVAAHREADPMHATPAPMLPAPAAGTKRVVNIDYEYDWLANMVRFEDDANLFYERSIGAIVNGQSTLVSGSANESRPSALYLADNTSTASASGHRGFLETTYDVGGNLATLTVHARCVDRSEKERCSASGTTLTARRNSLRDGCTCASEQHYAYRYDELNRMSEARRFDREAGSWELKVRQRYRYDAHNQRTLKQTLDTASGDARVALYVFDDDFERRGLRLGNTSYDAIAGDTESEYLVGGARVVWKTKSPLAGGIEPDHRITIAVQDLIQSTSAVIDLVSGEPLEVTGFYPNGAREHYWASSDPQALEIPLEPNGFTGKEAEEEVGLTYFGERYLVQRLGRWATPDPLSIHALGGGEIGNSYHYVSGNIFQARDPLGLAEPNDPEFISDPKPVKNSAGEGGYMAQTAPSGSWAPNAVKISSEWTLGGHGFKLFVCKGVCRFGEPLESKTSFFGALVDAYDASLPGPGQLDMPPSLIPDPRALTDAVDMFSAALTVPQSNIEVEEQTRAHAQLTFIAAVTAAGTLAGRQGYLHIEAQKAKALFTRLTRPLTAQGVRYAFYQTIGRVLKVEGQEARVAVFSELRKEIRKQDPRWAAVLHDGPDGAKIFEGSAGIMLVVDKEGKLYKGDLFDFKSEQIGKTILDKKFTHIAYENLKPLTTSTPEVVKQQD
jgi:RHS repeat-associated protein